MCHRRDATALATLLAISGVKGTNGLTGQVFLGLQTACMQPNTATPPFPFFQPSGNQSTLGCTWFALPAFFAHVAEISCRPTKCKHLAFYAITKNERQGWFHMSTYILRSCGLLGNRWRSNDLCDHRYQISFPIMLLSTNLRSLLGGDSVEIAGFASDWYLLSSCLTQSAYSTRGDV